MSPVFECREDGLYEDGRRISESLEEMVERGLGRELACRTWPLQVEANQRASDIFLSTTPQWATLAVVEEWYWWSGAWFNRPASWRRRITLDTRLTEA